MKKILLLLLLFISVSVNAQRLNSRGEKMIKRIEMFYNGEILTALDFSYDNACNLQRLYVKSDYHIAIYEKKDGQLHRAEKIRHTKDGKFENSGTFYSYILNSKGHIVKEIEDRHGIDGSILRFVYDYTYDMNYGRPLNTLCQTYYSEDKKKFEEADKDMQYTGWKDGNRYDSLLFGCKPMKDGRLGHTSPIEWEERVYSEEFINDTNIDFVLLEVNMGLWSHLEDITEWKNSKSQYLIEKDGKKKFSYKFSGTDCDNLGNIIEVKAEKKYHTYGGNTYKIYYVE